MQEQMKNKILYTDEARCDLDSIWDYIALDLQNQQAAERLVNKIMDRVDRWKILRRAECCFHPYRK